MRLPLPPAFDSLDSLRPVGRHDAPVVWVHDEAVGDLFVVGVLDPIVVVLHVVAEVLLAWRLFDTKRFTYTYSAVQRNVAKGCANVHLDQGYLDQQFVHITAVPVKAVSSDKNGRRKPTLTLRAKKLLCLDLGHGHSSFST